MGKASIARQIRFCERSTQLCLEIGAFALPRSYYKYPWFRADLWTYTSFLLLEGPVDACFLGSVFGLHFFVVSTWSLGPKIVEHLCFSGSVFGYFWNLVFIDYWLRFGVHFGVVSGSFSLRSWTRNVHFVMQFKVNRGHGPPEVDLKRWSESDPVSWPSFWDFRVPLWAPKGCRNRAPSLQKQGPEIEPKI